MSDSIGQRGRLILARGAVERVEANLRCVPLEIDRLTLSKKRWRGAAADGQEFGFDLEAPLKHGDVFYQTDDCRYAIVQRPEALLQLTLENSEQAARLGWLIGNLHFSVMLKPGLALTEDDPALRQMLEREGLSWELVSEVFRPLGGGHTHGRVHNKSASDSGDAAAHKSASEEGRSSHAAHSHDD